MTRPSTRRTMTLESLERREVLSAAPSVSAQYALSLMNFARTEPTAAAAWLQQAAANDPNVQATLNYYGVNLQQKVQQLATATAQPPLAYNSALGNAAQGHSQDMNVNNFQSHTGSDGSSPSDRVSNAGYGAAAAVGEDAFAYASSMENAIEAFLLDWGVSDDGHYKNIMEPGTPANGVYTEVGVGDVTTTDAAGAERDVVTIDFARSNNPQTQLVGVVFNDSNGNGVYGPNEGVGGVTIKAINLANGQSSTTTSASPGGYQMPLAAGQYDVEALDGNGNVLSSQNVTVGSTNVEADFNLLSPQNASSTYSQPAQAQAQAPAQVQAPAPVITPAIKVAAPAPAPAPVAPTPAAPSGALSSVFSWTAYKANIAS